MNWQSAFGIKAMKAVIPAAIRVTAVRLEVGIICPIIAVERLRLKRPAFTFDGETLKLNFRTSARGGIVLQILDEKNLPIEGYRTCELFGDALERIVDFERPLSGLQGKTVRFEFTMSDAELYAMRFE